jgi:type 1 glutamine amidotransferase
MKAMERQIKRGCGFMTFHFSTFAPDVLAPQILEWGGGYFDWQGDDGQCNWYSAIKTIADDLQLGTPQHPLANGVTPFRFKDEFYYRVRFRENDARLKPTLLAPVLGGTRLKHTVAWAVERRDGRRSFATTTGHYFSNWQNDNYRKLILNAIVWIASAKVLKEGVQSTYLNEAAVESAWQLRK